ncbi:DUF5916 domain-containing protein [Flavobacterium sp.]|uniref:DUF5916 domain-containing protein n=1 Tax=Flavobacterium sp. TaxID=239 RepID=UPI00286D8620|nr:DUF5916 domain-containing protein [Flavobacterium sp.]
MSNRLLLLTFVFSSCISFAQINAESEKKVSENQTLTIKKQLNSVFTTENITIDGKIDESIWKSAEIATDFISFEPDNGNPIPQNKKTEVRIVYNNDAIYIAATMYDDEPNKILKEFAQRDNFGAADFFGIFINGFNDGQQDFRFIVTAANTQNDCQASESEGEDYSWDAIWNSKTTVTDFGWVAEIKIPYAALRFSPEKKQIWGINFMREVRRDRQKYTWNFVDAKLGTFIQQAGTLQGIENIKTPTRLFFLPYSSYYLNANKENKTKGTLKGGLDIKYGINDAFTLDMALIPDFGQTAVDQKILNLGPFEQQFNENRSFFTEGTDLFNKGGLVYSRRIGGRPTGEIVTNANEEIIKQPSSVGLLNALKISGRTKNGLGIGVLNAVTEVTVARIRNNTNGIVRGQVVEPLTNYNVLVFDQRFNKNSSVSLINTNVTRNGGFRDGNVTGLIWDLNTKANTFNLQGNYKLSVVNEVDIEKTKYGSNGYLEFNKTSGKYRFGLGADLFTKKYDNNDLGINFQTNFFSTYGNASYRILNPNKHFNRFNININSYNEFQIETGKPQFSNININLNIGSKKNNAYGMNINSNSIETYDYYEPRVDGRYFIQPQRIGFGGYYSSNYNNKFAYDIESNFSWADQKGRNAINLTLSPRYRKNDKISFVFRYNYSRNRNNKGFATKINTDNNDLTPDDIIIANRNIISFTNTLTAKYSVNSDMNFNLSAIHYWSYSENKDFLLLEENGRFSPYLGTVDNLNQDFSTWNLDISYTWWFVPGSQLSILYRNNSFNELSNINKNYTENYTNLIRNEVLNQTFSISLKYFIDYNQAKNWF